MLAQVSSLSKSSEHLIFRRRNQVVLPARIASQAILAARLGIVAVLVFPAPGFAAEWSMTPALRLSYEQNDNIRMTLQPHDAVHGSVVAPRLDMGVQSEIWGITGSAEVAQKRYSESDLDRDFETFRLLSRYSMERNSFTLSASRVNDASISGDEVDPDLGRTTVQVSRRTESVQPTWSWSMTERAQLQLGYQLSEVSYAGGENNGLYDYQNRAATATWSYAISPRSQFFFTANYSKFRAPNTNIQSVAFDGISEIESTFTSTDSRNKSFRAGFSHAFSESMQGTLMLGQRKTETEREVTQCIYLGGFFLIGCFPGAQLTDDTGTTFSGDLKKKFDQLDITTTISRDVTASGTGAQVEWDSVSVRLDRPFTPRLKGALTATGSKLRHIDDVVSATTDLEQYIIQPAISWVWTQEADLSLSYRYWHLKREGENQPVQSHAVYLTLNYTLTKFSISR